MDASKQRFFDTMERDIVEAITDSPHGATTTEDGLDIDFSVTESGRTIAHMVAQESEQHYDDLATMGLSEADQDDFVRSFATTKPHEQAVNTSNNTAISKGAVFTTDYAPQTHRVLPNTSSSARSIPVPAPNKTFSGQAQSASAASSQGSSGSAFLSSVLNPAAVSTFGNGQQMLSHTPPTALGTSYEASHFGKRARSGSVSGRLRSASEYLEDKGMLDRETHGILKDLIIMGDEDLQQAIDRYEGGDPSILESMISSGALQDRLPKDIDILGAFDLDFLTMDDNMGQDGDIEPLNDEQAAGSSNSTSNNNHNNKSAAQPIPMHPGAPAGAQARANQAHGPNMVSPPYDDGIGDLEFAGDFVSDQADFMQLQEQTFSNQNSAAASPSEPTMSDYERRLRSNSLFSALLNDPRGGTTTAGADGQDAQYGQWMDMDRAAAVAAAAASKKPGISIHKQANRRASAPVIKSGLGASLEQYKGDPEKLQVLTKEEQKRRDKKEKKEKKEREKQERKEKKELAKKKAAEDEMVVHVPGSGRPRALSDPNLTTTLDQHGLMEVDRPDGWVGAYSPESRKARIGRFMEKRNHRVWTKTVKYDVRKNFADSRLRVKGRFVKKEDELLMRELMSLT